MSEPRSTLEEAAKAGLIALQAQGLEPSQYARDLMAKVVVGELTPHEMEATLVEYYRRKTRATQRRRIA
jgi:hypothetical protein